MLAPASAADLAARDAGGGRVSLRWTFPGDHLAAGVVFDVYSGTDPLQPFRTRRLSAHGELAAQLSGFEAGGEHFFTVVARRGEQLALPSAAAWVDVEPVVAATPLEPTTGDPAPRGLGFPFRIAAAGGVHAEGGDPLLRSRVLALLLTAPGERVNLPEYGTRLRDLVFDPGNDILAAATEFAVARSLRRYLGDVLHLAGVRVASEAGELRVDITYLRASDLSTDRLLVGIPIVR